MDDFASVLKRGLAGAGKGAPLLVAGLIAGLVYAVGLFNRVDVTTADTPTILVSALISFIPLVVIPYVTGGALGYALEASAGGKPGWQTFFEAARKHYASLFLAGIAIFLLFNLAALIMISGTANAFTLCMMFLFGVIGLFVVMMFLEFFDVAIVSGDLSAMDGLRASIAFVRANLRRVLPFFLIVVVAKLFVQLPAYTADMLRMIATIGSNFSLMFNNTTNGTLNESYLNATQTALATPMSTSSLIAVAGLQILVQIVVFAFVISFKAEFWRWAKSYKPAKKITDFDYDFSDEKSE
ncbi:MAG TPA: hypothetical protein VGJ92_08940 [Methanocella sp.]|jgi:hypothetical protein